MSTEHIPKAIGWDETDCESDEKPDERPIPGEHKTTSHLRPLGNHPMEWCRSFVSAHGFDPFYRWGQGWVMEWCMRKLEGAENF